MFFRIFFRFLAAAAVSVLVSCGSVGFSVSQIPAYRMEIQQGNFVSPDMVSQLKLGMTKDQVRFALGTPLISDTFHADRWDYVFRRQRSGSKELEQYKLAVFFEDSKLARIDSDLTPAAKPDATAAKPDAAAAKPAAPAAQSEAQSTPAIATPVVVLEKPAAVPIPADRQPDETKGR